MFDVVVTDFFIGVAFAPFDSNAGLAGSDPGHVGNLIQDRLDLCLACDGEVECVACPALDEHIPGFCVIVCLVLRLWRASAGCWYVR